MYEDEHYLVKNTTQWHSKICEINPNLCMTSVLTCSSSS